MLFLGDYVFHRKCLSLQPKVAHYYVSGRYVYGRPAERFLGNGLRMVDVGCGDLDAETRGIDVTQRAESIGEGIRV